MKAIMSLLIICTAFSYGQPYLKENGKTRHRFAQSVFGIDLETAMGGETSYINSDGFTEQKKLSPDVSPRFYISGVHFWGHAEFYFSFQFKNYKNKTSEVNTYFAKGDVFGSKIYPWPIRKKKIRPFIGTSFSYVMFKQNSGTSKGPVKYKTIFPVSAGINYCTGKYLFEAGVSWNPSPEQEYFISETQRSIIYTPPFLVSFGIRKWLETTVASEKNYLNGETERRYKFHREQKELSSWFVGVGPSSAFYLNESEFNYQLYPFVMKPFSVIFPEISAGYFLEPARVHFSLAFRHHRKKTESYSVKQKYIRSSASAESFIYLFDYQGFNPYVGIAGSFEHLIFQHEQAGEAFNSGRSFFSPGIIAGWDILPDKLQGFVLRTNLRYFPIKMREQKSRKTIDFSQIEFNFIQVIFYPQRMKVFARN